MELNNKFAETLNLKFMDRTSVKQVTKNDSDVKTKIISFKNTYNFSGTTNQNSWISSLVDRKYFFKTFQKKDLKSLAE